MFEALESRQLFSVAVTSAATETTADSPAPAAIDADGTGLDLTSGTDGQQEYYLVKLKPVYITSYQTGGSAHPGGMLVALGDGSVRFLQASVADASNQTLLVVHTRSG